MVRARRDNPQKFRLSAHAGCSTLQPPVYKRLVRVCHVSDLIRSAIEEKYLRTARQRVDAFRVWQAPWRDREDITDAAEYVRELRQDGRLDRLYPE
jgi:hypothetical protein